MDLQFAKFSQYLYPNGIGTLERLFKRYLRA